jgi:nitronate monooxygenase
MKGKLMKTTLCTILGIEAPIVQAPLRPGARAELAAAVSNAGGLGMLGWDDLAGLRDLIRATQALTSKPFGVNFILSGEKHEFVQVCMEEGVAAVSFFWGDPAPYVSQIHDGGAIVMHTVGSASEARTSVANGTDVIVAQGWEAGGHVWGTVATFALVPAVVDAVAPKPVVAAGGISDGRGLAAALALGASGAWIGTRFVASQEAWMHPAYKQRVVDACETDTVYSSLFDGGWPNAPHRTLRNSTIERWQEAGSPPSGMRPGEGDVIVTISGRPIRRYSACTPIADSLGDTEPMANYAGQSAALVREVLPAGEIVAAIVSEAEKTLRKLRPQ